ncbi:MAG TPA: aminotransferase class I/II-fold pyridoxal phosphate-dependent enzyme [Chloroflexota bacterium]|nr:aminotransferase class I/II-fold pyridoxal phosphate-dependent enzyme [Chloroflexota bacterium]
MGRRVATVTAVTVPITLETDVPLYRQVYDGLREAILDGRLKAGERLPSTRTLAGELKISRNTVLAAFDQLLSEGYLQGARGSGTYVARVLPEDLQRPLGRARPAGTTALGAVGTAARTQGHLTALPGAARGAAPGPSGTAGSARGTGLPGAAGTPGNGPVAVPASAGVPGSGGLTLRRRGSLILGAPLPPSAQVVPSQGAQRAFRLGAPALDAFPSQTWGRLVARRWRRSSASLMSYQDTAGYLPLREAIAGYLSASRGVRCTAEQVIVVGGSQQALDMILRALLDPWDDAWIEDPGYLGARGAMLAAGIHPIAVPVDEQGMNVAAGIAASPQARLAYVSPSHQFPIGVTMSLPRRLALLEWAAKTGAWVLEDDYDSEFRYDGRPLAALQGLDREGRVIYVGTFSKVLFPGLRLGYLVLPPALIDLFHKARFFNGIHSQALEQAALADFIAEGHFARHVRRMRALYAERQQLLANAMHPLRGLVELQTSPAGMHAVGWLGPQFAAQGGPAGQAAMIDRAAARAAAAHGVTTQPLSVYCIEPLRRGALLLGYAACSELEIRDGVRRLVQALESLTRSGTPNHGVNPTVEPAPPPAAGAPGARPPFPRR